MSREKQIDEMAKAICEHYVKGGCGRCPDCFCEGDALKLYNAGYRKQEWISVEERLPKDERDVLAYYGFDRGDGDLGMMFIGVLSYFAYDPKPHFQHEASGLRVTHWMPIPEPPKGE